MYTEEWSCSLNYKFDEARMMKNDVCEDERVDKRKEEKEGESLQ